MSAPVMSRCSVCVGPIQVDCGNTSLTTSLLFHVAAFNESTLGVLGGDFSAVRVNRSLFGTRSRLESTQLYLCSTLSAYNIHYTLLFHLRKVLSLKHLQNKFKQSWHSIVVHSIADTGECR